jgi:hypothetical protein
MRVGRRPVVVDNERLYDLYYMARRAVDDPDLCDADKKRMNAYRYMINDAWRDVHSTRYRLPRLLRWYYGG